MAIICPICNVVLTDSEQHFHRECKPQNDEGLTQANINDVLMCETVSDTFSILDEIQLEDLGLSDEQMQDILDDLYEDDGSLDLHNVRINDNELRVQIPNERGALLSDPDNFNNDSGIQNPNNQKFF
ncbi:hypothetical protein TNIN_59841 [Trichonephila inaurata madagascariensis]|uniref:Uncharacterized protein n=1 Tax=Trichonephila inaurata madagascariensis TaxID=2747483 RepID=A0A8X6JT19_9ARAC|nr:hypothetical protein TNIN_59841 [Trichonephila inaurata madagascariensis]